MLIKSLANFISIGDLYLAYKKAKADAYFDQYHPTALEFANFEQDLKVNLRKLLRELTDQDADWFSRSEYLGGFLYSPKSISSASSSESIEFHFRDVDPIRDWSRRFLGAGGNCPIANYRMSIAPTIEYQIISALWIIKVGQKFDATIDKEHSYGNRLRRKLAKDGAANGALNLSSMGLFAPYFTAYQAWRGRGLKAMRDSIVAGEDVIAVTMDVAKFYHNVGPDFLLRRSFLEEVEIVLDESERRFTQQLLSSMTTWYRSTPDYEDRPEGALPVGLSASKIISNVLLARLDREVIDSIAPIYYGRYVDDIFLVVSRPSLVESGQEVVRWLAKTVPSLKLKQSKGKAAELRLVLSYAKDSDLYFTADKQKVFSLSSEHGLDLVGQIESQIREQSSEYRLMPDVPKTSSKMASRTLLANSDASLSADALRKADGVSIKRLGFVLLLRDIESYSSNLRRNEWSEIRHEFYGLVDRHLLNPKGMFELFTYYPRVFRLMISNEDFEIASRFLDGLEECLNLVEETTRSDKSKLDFCRQYFEKSLLQSSIQASTARTFSGWTALGRVLRRLFQISDAYWIKNYAPALKKRSHRVLLADLGLRPYKDYWYYSQDSDIKDVRIPRSPKIQGVIQWLKIKRFRTAASLKIPHWPALAFPTRPLSLQEIVLVAPSVLHDDDLLADSIKGLRGAGLPNASTIGFVQLDGEIKFSVPNKRKRGEVIVALTNLETTDKQWSAAAENVPDRSLARYEKLNSLVNRILGDTAEADYLIFPECSIPRRWAFEFGRRLGQQGISLICGLEYFPQAGSTRVVRNDCLVSLATRWPGYQSNIVYLQPKLSPSHGERRSLSKLRKKQYAPVGSEKIPPIYRHGNFYFGILICSDLTTPENRVRFQGKIDTLFVLEWNRDTNTFGFLVEGAAHDIHAFVAQANNRQYGDSRIRAPYREEHKRDSVRIKGGTTDYYVLGEIDYMSLRAAQSKRVIPEKGEFKPVPIGFEIADWRKT